MSDLFADGVIIPMIVLLILGWSVPQGLARVMPEGVTALFLLAGVATVFLIIAAGAFFAILYGWRGAQLEVLSPTQTVVHFGRLGVLSALIWLPVMILSVANLPRRWVKETW